MKKVIFSAALLMAAATVSFAGNPKGETKPEAKTETKTEVKAEAKAKSGLITYYVLSKSATHYNITTTAPNPSPCGSGSAPCQFTSEEDLGSSVLRSDVDSEAGDIEITEVRNSVPNQ